MIKPPPACGIEIIKRFENCHLTAYPDPKTKGRPYTIGWGSTRKRNGQPFQLGEKITQAEADDLFSYQIEKEFMPALAKIPHFAQMNEEQVGALLSFAYNLGANFYGAEGFATISRRLRNREWDLVPEALLLYRNPGTDVEAGLRRRRVAEGALWSKGTAKHNVIKQQIIALRPTVLKKEPVQSYQLTYNQRKEVPQGKGYQIISIVNEGTHSKVTLDYGAGVWYIYNPHWELTPVNGVVEAPSASSRVLKVKYFSQRDSATVHAHRMCFSSSCAMMADYLNPTAIQVAEQEDDYYMKNFVFKYGDTTNPNAQVSALRDLGITAQFRQNLSPQDVIDQIDKGIPVPVGFLHHGPVNAPRGGGHWIVIIGYDLNSKQWIVHDPYGELDVVGGGYYGSTNGANQRYTFRNFNRRWEVNNDGTSAPGKGWGIIATAW
jgi:GH24 family phage-related lysozyme (muramidase)